MLGKAWLYRRRSWLHPGDPFNLLYLKRKTMLIFHATTRAEADQLESHSPRSLGFNTPFLSNDMTTGPESLKISVLFNRKLSPCLT
jgi:hypothetical protein